MKEQPTPEQIAALERFAERYGRYWKEELSTMWMRASYPRWMADSGDDALLQQVRNQFGPSWLYRYRRPK